MKIITDYRNHRSEVPSAVAVGKFDALHLGHRVLLNAIVRERKNGLSPVVVTIEPDEQNAVLLTDAEKEAALSMMGLDTWVRLPFSEVRDLSAEAFVETVLKDRLQTALVVAGDDFHFGRDRQGDPEFLQECGEKDGFQVRVIPRVEASGEVISSKKIRDAVVSGKLDRANAMLGYPYFMTGRVQHGRRLAGALGFPTMNLSVNEKKLIPAYGVYFTEVTVDCRKYPGIAHIGVKPTVGGKEPLLEVHLPHETGDFYGSEVKVSFLHFHRPEQKFESIDALKAQVEKDLKAFLQ
ncbi:MAG: riboflavin biosynthesis protein RibF [Lachnospiraceae bacterium]|nr:riboflavin biosynthesis protein RibF [Lachnospiraceae bacterium]